MFDRLKSSYRKRLLEKLRRQRLLKSDGRRMLNYDDVKTVAMLFQVRDEGMWQMVLRIARGLENEGKKVFLIGTVPSEGQSGFIVDYHDVTVFHDGQDFNFLGLPKHELLTPFERRKYDLFIDLSGSHSFFSQYVALRVDATLICAYVANSSSSDVADPPEAFRPSDIFDFSIIGNSPMDMQFFVARLTEYLRKIKK